MFFFLIFVESGRDCAFPQIGPLLVVVVYECWKMFKRFNNVPGFYGNTAMLGYILPEYLKLETQRFHVCLCVKSNL